MERVVVLAFSKFFDVAAPVRGVWLVSQVVVAGVVCHNVSCETREFGGRDCERAQSGDDGLIVTLDFRKRQIAWPVVVGISITVEIENEWGILG